MHDTSHLAQRLSRHERRAKRLAALTDAELGALLSFDRQRPLLWGGACEFELDGEQIFAKRIPLTPSELARPGATDNYHGLPMVYHYGVGSLGFGAWRELAIVQRIVDDAHAGLPSPFPLLAHQRVMTVPDGQTRKDAAGLADYARIWRSDTRVLKLATERSQATQALVLFFEYVPHTLREWLSAHQSRTGPVLKNLLDALVVLRKRGVVHLDAHFENVLIDEDERIYVIDFGLAIDERFDMSADERAFFEAHLRAHYDAGEALACVPFMLAGQYWSLSDADKNRFALLCGLARDEHNFYALSGAIAQNLQALADSRILRIDPALIDAFTPHRDVAQHMLDFYTELSRDDAKSARLDLDRLQTLLTQSRAL